MAYRVVPFLVTLSDLWGQFTYLWQAVQLCCSWQDFNWQRASRGSSAL